MNALMNKNHRVTIADSILGLLETTHHDHGFSRHFKPVVHEMRDCYRLELAVPGFNRRDITIEVDSTSMTILAAKEISKDAIRRQALKHSLPLPSDADVNAIEARCRDGMLEVTIPKVKVPGAHRVIKIDADRDEGRADTFLKKLTEGVNDLRSSIRGIFKGRRRTQLN